MKIIIIGASGKIGRKVTEEFQKEHEVITVGLKSGDFQVDITSEDSIKDLFRATGSFDALISATGDGHFGPIREMTAKDFSVGLNFKLLGQVNLVLIGQKFINPGGSFTLTSGILSEDPIRLGANLSVANAGINAFVLAAAVELDNDVRINAVSPGVIEDSPDLHPFFPGHIPAKMHNVKNAYKKSVLGAGTGKVIKAW